MTNAELIAKIKAEIERLYDGEAPEHDPQCDFSDGYFTALSRIDEFLDTLESEKPTQEGLEEEVKRWMEKYTICDDLCVINKDDGANITPADIEQIARHFAKWQKEQDEKEQADLFTIVALDAAQRTKEQMMKDAVEGMVCATIMRQVAISFLSPLPKELKTGDKVRMIILKKED